MTCALPPVFRFAPCPNGYLHLGHALSALTDFEMARALGGRFLLRIEDIDATRCRPEFEQAIYEDLAWLGIAWEEPVRRQSEHLDAYRRCAREARRICVYPSFESRAEIARLVAERERRGHWPRDPDGAPLYPGDAKRLSAAERGARMARRALRAAARHERRGRAHRHAHLGRRSATASQEHETVMAHPEVWGDVVLARKETPTSYHLSVVVDDALQGVTHVVRGQDLQPATSVHRVLQALLGLPAPVYHHHRLVLDEEGRKLSKSTRATALRELRSQGFTPADIRRRVGITASLP